LQLVQHQYMNAAINRTCRASNTSVNTLTSLLNSLPTNISSAWCVFLLLTFKCCLLEFEVVVIVIFHFVPFLPVILLSFLLWFTTSDYPFGIFILFYEA
jgi:hypothetical protein